MTASHRPHDPPTVPDTSGGPRDSGLTVGESPVDDRTYNLLQALTSKLEAIAAYEQYVLDDTDGTFEGLIAEERRHAQVLLEALRRSIAA